MTSDNEFYKNLAADECELAWGEVAFLLEAFAGAVDTIMGGNIAPVGRVAGRDTAQRLPVELTERTVAAAIDYVAQKFAAGFEIAQQDGTLEFGHCAIRSICQLRGQAPGGAPCRLFHAWFDGVVNGLVSRPVKSAITECGELCRIKFDAQ